VQFTSCVDRGTAAQEAMMKMQIADSIFDDLIADTATAFLEATGQELPT